jgi:hypothetical protein
LFVQALVGLWLAAVALRFVGFRRCHSALDRMVHLRRLAAEAPTEALHQRARFTARMVQAAAGTLACRASCLRRSLILWWLLRRQGIESTLRVGVRQGPTGLAAHAWVECLGQVLNDDADVGQRFAGFDRSVVAAGLRCSYESAGKVVADDA